MSHGPASAPMPSPHFAMGAGKRAWVGLLFFQLSWEPVKEVVLRGIVPPAVGHLFAAAQLFSWIRAPVGTAARLVEKLFWRENSARNVFRTNDEYITLAPPRTTVVPLPLRSQAKPKRGEK